MRSCAERRVLVSCADIQAQQARLEKCGTGVLPVHIASRKFSNERKWHGHFARGYTAWKAVPQTTGYACRSRQGADKIETWLTFPI